MGAEFISENREGHLKPDELGEELEQMQSRDNQVNGHRQGYSGDWQTVNSIKTGLLSTTDGGFVSVHDALEFIQENAEKWEYGVAIHAKDGDTEITVMGCWAAS